MKFEKTNDIKRLFEILDRIFKNAEDNDIVYYGYIKKNIKLVSSPINADNKNVISCVFLKEEFIELKNKNFIFWCGTFNNKPTFNLLLKFLENLLDKEIIKIGEIQIANSYCCLIISDAVFDNYMLETISKIACIDIKEDIVEEEDILTYNNLTSFLHYYGIPITYLTTYNTIKNFENKKIKDITKTKYFKSLT